MSTVKPRRDMHAHRMLKPAFAASHSPYIQTPAAPSLAATQKRPVLLQSRRKLNEIATAEPRSKRPMKLPQLQAATDNIQPISPFFGKENKDPEDLCLPYELEDTLRPLRKDRVVFKGGKPPADLKRGAFSRKHTFRADVSVLSEQNTSLEHSVLDFPSCNNSFVDTLAVKCDSRSQSPITTGRSNKLQQLSRRFKLNRVELSKQVRRGQSEEPQPLIPSSAFLQDLQALLS